MRHCPLSSRLGCLQSRLASAGGLWWQTNIAEASITVDGVVYVIDTGVVKQKSYDPQTGMDSLSVVPISRVQATQRAGRAGRTRPGKCFRLYTKAYYEKQMPAETVPEIQRTSMLAAVLYLKSLSRLDVDVLGFDYLDPRRERHCRTRCSSCS
eukprot:jgi/Botrbrau1/266/Bobra.0022s0235.1